MMITLISKFVYSYICIKKMCYVRAFIISRRFFITIYSVLHKLLWWCIYTYGTNVTNYLPIYIIKSNILFKHSSYY